MNKTKNVFRHDNILNPKFQEEKVNTSRAFTLGLGYMKKKHCFNHKIVNLLEKKWDFTIGIYYVIILR